MGKTIQIGNLEYSMDVRDPSRESAERFATSGDAGLSGAALDLRLRAKFNTIAYVPKVRQSSTITSGVPIRFDPQTGQFADVGCARNPDGSAQMNGTSTVPSEETKYLRRPGAKKLGASKRKTQGQGIQKEVIK